MGQAVDEGLRASGFKIPVLHAQLRSVHDVDEIIGGRKTLGDPGDEIPGGVAGGGGTGLDQGQIDRIRFLQRSPGIVQPSRDAVIGLIRPRVQFVDSAGLRVEMDRRSLERLEREIQVSRVAPHILKLPRRALIGGQCGEAQCQFFRNDDPVDVQTDALRAFRVQANIQAVTVGVEAAELVGRIKPTAHRAETEEQRIGPTALGHRLGVEIINFDPTGEKVVGQRRRAKAAHGERRARARGNGFRIGGVAFERLGARQKLEGLLVVYRADIAHKFLGENGDRVGQVAHLRLQLGPRQRLRGVISFVGIGADDKGVQDDRGVFRRRSGGGGRRSDRLGESGSDEERQSQGKGGGFHFRTG